MIRFNMKFDGDQKIGAIKLIREATGASLLDAKTLVEATDRPEVRVTEEQFGALVGRLMFNAETEDDSPGPYPWDFNIKVIEIVRGLPPKPRYDFTVPQEAPPPSMKL